MAESTRGRTFWTDARLHRLALAVCLALFAGYVFGQLLLPESSALRRGDLPAFYAAGSLTLHGRIDEIYNPQVLKLLQHEHWPEMEGYLHFAYPPYVAVLCAPLALLSPLMAKLAVDLLMVVALWLSAYLMSSVWPALKGRTFLLFTYLLVFIPITSGVFGAQNTALSLLCYTAVLAAMRLPSPKSDFYAGLALGAWMFKPHFAGILLIVALLCGRFRILAGAVPMLLFYDVLAVWGFGGAWPKLWWSMLQDFNAQENIFNQTRMVSLVSVAERSVPGNAMVVAAAQTAAIVILLLLVWRYYRSSRKQNGFLRVLELGGPAVVLAAPHVLFYDLGLAVLPSIAAARIFESDRRISQALLFSLVAGFVTFVQALIPVQPLVFIALGCFVFLFSKPIE